MAGMKRRDARALDHKTLEEIRIRAVERVQAGESPETVIQALALREAAFTPGWPGTAAGVGVH